MQSTLIRFIAQSEKSSKCAFSRTLNHPFCTGRDRQDRRKLQDRPERDHRAQRRDRRRGVHQKVDGTRRFRDQVPCLDQFLHHRMEVQDRAMGKHFRSPTLMMSRILEELIFLYWVATITSSLHLTLWPGRCRESSAERSRLSFRCYFLKWIFTLWPERVAFPHVAVNCNSRNASRSKPTLHCRKYREVAPWEVTQWSMRSASDAM